MARYRKVPVQFWNDRRVREEFTDDGRLAVLYIMTCPAMTSVGSMRGTLAGLAAELRWPVRKLERALAPAIKAGIVEYNEAAAYIGLLHFHESTPESPNVCRGWATAIATLIPECPERVALVDRCRAFLQPGPFRQAFDQGLLKAFGGGLPEDFRCGLPEVLAKALPNQEQEQEQEQEKEGENDSPAVPAGPLLDSVMRLLTLHSQLFEARCGQMPRPERCAQPIVRDTVRKYGEEQTEAWLRDFLASDDPYWIEHRFSFSIFQEAVNVMIVRAAEGRHRR
jgi:hypothetical protein